MTDPKAAEREAAVRAWIKANEDSNDPTDALVALLATRERDAAVGALMEAEADLRAAGIVFYGKGDVVDARDMCGGLADLVERRRLALEQGTPATREETPRSCLLMGGPEHVIFVRGKRVVFEDNPRAGPHPITQTGTPRKTSDRDPFWEAVTMWIRQGRRVDEKGVCVWDRVPSEPTTGGTER